MYTITEVNSLKPYADTEIAELRKIYQGNFNSFGGSSSMDDYVSAQIDYCTAPNHISQTLFIKANNGDIVTSVEVIARKGMYPNTVNLFLSMVYTNRDYRGQGMASKLLHWIVNYYENGTIDSDTSLYICESIKNGESQKYIDSILSQSVRDENNAFWSLFSVVGEFYKRFGFEPSRNVNWLEINATRVNSVNHLDFKLEKNERLLTINDLDKYYFEPSHSFPPLNDQHFQNCSIEESTYPASIKRLQNYVSIQSTEIENPEYFQTCGILINNELDQAANTHTVVFVQPFYVTGKIVISRVFTSVPDKTTFYKHWEKALEFVYSYAQTYWTAIPAIKTEAESNKGIFMNNNDFICSSKAVSNAEFVNLVTNTHHWTNTGSDTKLPMIRDWKQHKKDPSQLANNGFWYFM